MLFIDSDTYTFDDPFDCRRMESYQESVSWTDAIDYHQFSGGVDPAPQSNFRREIAGYHCNDRLVHTPGKK